MPHPCAHSFGRRFISAARPSPLSSSSVYAACCHIHMTSSPCGGRGSFFAFFSLPKSPDLNVSTVKQAFHDLQRQVHPDRANAQAKEREEKAQEPRDDVSAAMRPSASLLSADTNESSYANAAYHTLRDPFLRCKYLARLSRAEKAKGAPLSAAEEEALMGEDDQRALEENHRLRGGSEGEAETALGEKFLMEMMAANELIFTADAMQEEGAAALKLLLVDMEERDGQYYSQAKDMWKRGDFSSFRRCVLEWTYIRNALNNVKDRIH